MKKYIAFFILTTAVLTGCYYDNKEEMYPVVSGDCDTSNVTYSLTVQPTLNSYCISCHGNDAASYGGNIKLNSYNDVKTYVDNGKLLGAITWLPNYSPMPKSSSKLDDCKINQIKAWINNGANND